MYSRLCLFLASCALVAYSASSKTPTAEQAQSLSKTLALLLGFETAPDKDWALRQVSNVPSALSAQMQELYDDYRQSDEHPDGNIVRGLLPKYGKVKGEDALTFDISQLKASEKVLRVELHFSLPHASRHTTRRRSRAVRASAICTHQFCSQHYNLPIIDASRSSAVFDATLPLAQLHSLNNTMFAVKMWRKDIRMRSARELARRNPPFLLVFSEGDEVPDMDGLVGKVHEEIEKSKHLDDNRIRAKRNADYFKYGADGNMNVKASIRKMTKAQRFAEKQRKDPWYGFGEPSTTTERSDEDEDSEEDDEETSEVDGPKEGVDVVLLDGKRADQLCSRARLAIPFSSLALDHVVVAPKNFDADYCDGVCPFPLPKAAHPSPRALIHSILAPTPSCCSPTTLRPLVVLHVDVAGNFVLRVFERMVAEQCACA